MEHTLWLDELFATCICVPYTVGKRQSGLHTSCLCHICISLQRLEKMESCLCHILFSKIMIDWKSFYANGGYSNGNSDPLSYENGCDNEDEEYNDIMREEWHRRMEEE